MLVVSEVSYNEGKRLFIASIGQRHVILHLVKLGFVCGSKDKEFVFQVEKYWGSCLFDGRRKICNRRGDQAYDL